jgi:hypothetical protein
MIKVIEVSFSRYCLKMRAKRTKLDECCSEINLIYLQFSLFPSLFFFFSLFSPKAGDSMAAIVN